ncbi:MAG: threonine synthase [Deltaproteobacteria bacterium]|nr:threonine synthase [Deltaproteobacteria bacterium]
MKFYSTNKSVEPVTLDRALLQGQAADKGLYLPESIPAISKDLLKNARDMSYEEIAAKVLISYSEGIFTEDEIIEICTDAYDFEVPVEKVVNRSHILRLDHGPTASFKDFAARFMGRAIGRLVAKRGEELLILTATSGDTGSAVANAFLGVEGIRVLVLFPVDEVSVRQRKQMTTLGDNVTMIAVNGKFDDCQALVKQAFGDGDLNDLNLSSANSINIGRLLPQSVYYIYAASRIADIAGGEKTVISVPSGNFGNLMGGILAFKSGLPVEKFVVSTNANDEVPVFFRTGDYNKIEPSKVCISNAMNVGHPSNLARLVDLYGGHIDEKGILAKVPDMNAINRDFFSVSIDDNSTRETIKRVYNDYNIVLEPHGAVGWKGLEHFFEANPQLVNAPAISLETAHPAKFPDEVISATGVDPKLPKALMGLDDKDESFGNMNALYSEFKDILKKDFR